MDIFAIEAVVLELAKKLPGSLVNKIHQPTGDDLILRLWTGREELRLLLSASPTLSRIHLTDEQWPNPYSPPHFCQLLRARLVRATGIEQIPGERIVRISFQAGEVLVAELVGRHANVVLVDGCGIVIDALKRSGGKGKTRELRPGAVYRYPSRPERYFLGDGTPEVPSTVGSGTDFEKWLMAHIAPMSPLVARDLAAGLEKGLSAWQVLEEFKQKWLGKDFRPVTGRLRGKMVLSAFSPEHLSLETACSFKSVSAAADDFYYRQAFHGGGMAGRSRLDDAVRRGLKSLNSRLGKIKKELEASGSSEDRRRFGELILANLHQLHKGMTEATLEDFSQEPPVSVIIGLDPALTPQENAQRYFRDFKKGKRGRPHLERRMEETRRELEWLEQVALALDEAEQPGELFAIREELETAGMIRSETGPSARRRPTDPKEGVHSILSPGGFLLYWGKNNQSNDFVTRHLGRPEDLWFHAHNLPGCHLVLRKVNKKDKVPEEDVQFAAAIAAGYSRGRDDAKVEVMVAEGRWVRKPKGARPGLVSVERYRTVMVRPNRPGTSQGETG